MCIQTCTEGKNNTRSKAFEFFEISKILILMYLRINYVLVICREKFKNQNHVRRAKKNARGKTFLNFKPFA